MRVVRFLREALSGEKLAKIEKAIIRDARAGRHDEAWRALEPLLGTQRRQEAVAESLLRIVDDGHLPRDRALDVLAAVHDAHPRNAGLLAALGRALELARDIDMLNAPPPEHPLFASVTDTLAELARAATGSETEIPLLRGLSTAARMMARQRDEVVERSCRRLIELEPRKASHHYNFGLFLKTRGRFREGMVANQTGIGLLGEAAESYEWNLGICATGAGEGAAALAVWQGMKQHIAMGRFGLPEGSYPQCKVRLAQRPLAERTGTADDPGLEETVWVERLSPCHGIIRSVLYQDLGVDYGDVVLFDGAPITYHTYGDKKIAVFPHLATLVRNRYQVFDFAGTQEQAGQIAGATADLERDAVVYSHSESFVVMCASCWRDPDVNHAHEGEVTKHVVRGQIAAPADFEARELLRQLDAALAKREPCRLYVPELCEQAGFAERAAVERRRFGMIAGAESAPPR